MKKLLAVIICSVMIVALLPVAVSARTWKGNFGENDEYYFIYDYTADNYDPQNSASTLEIGVNEGFEGACDGVLPESELVDEFPWNEVASNKARTYLRSVTFKDGITYIPKGMFTDSSLLNTVVIEGNLTSIGDRAFEGVTALKSLVLPDSVSSIGKYAFRYSGIESINVPAGLVDIAASSFFVLYPCVLYPHAVLVIILCAAFSC